MKLERISSCLKSNQAVLDDSKRYKNSKVFHITRSQILQFTYSVGVSLGALGHGAAGIWTSPALPYLKSNESEIRVTGDQGSWIASLLNMGGVIGFLLYPLLVDRIGRKYTMMTFFVPQFFSWILIYFAKNVEVLYVARMICGIGYNAGFAVQITYIGEIAEKNIRGSLVLVGMIFYHIGILIALTAGAFLSYDNMNLILLLLSLLFVVNFIFLPESPYFHLLQNREEDAVKCLCKLRGTRDSEAVQIEINKIKEDIIESQSHEKYTLRKLFGTKRHRKSLLIVFIANASVSFSGVMAISAFSQEIISYSGIDLAPKYAAIILTFVSFILIFITTPVIDYFGRRSLTLFSGMMGALSLGVVGMFFFFHSHPKITDMSSVSWLPLVALIIFEVAGGRGLISTAVVLSSELFSLEVKSLAFCFAQVTNELLSFLVKLGFDKTVSTFGVHSLFWTYAFFCLVLPIINFYIMPETRGKTLEEIQHLLD